MHAYKIRQHEDFVIRDRGPVAKNAQVVVRLADAGGNVDGGHGNRAVRSPARELQQSLESQMAARVDPGLSARARMAIIAGLASALWAAIGTATWVAIG